MAIDSVPVYEKDPWNVPVPVRPCDWTPLHPQHQELAVCSDLGAIRAFQVPTGDPPEGSVLYADLQTAAGENVLRRLGSGRAGFYRGKYLKGIGRTSLAGNWNDASDTYHATGHMFPSSAIREYVASAYLRAKGAAHLIVPCEGLLARRLDKSFQRQMRAFQNKVGSPLPAVDLELQAVSIKDARFARFSNLNWLFTSIGPSALGLASAAYLLQGYSRHPDQPWPDPRRCTASTVVRELSDAVARGIDAFAAYFRLGIWWGSFYNNFTLDGRFLDLEVPVIHGRPFVGCFLNHPTPQIDRQNPPGLFSLVGVEVFDYGAHVLASVGSFVSRLRFLRGTARERPVREFAGGLAEALESAFNVEHLLRSRERMCEFVCGLMVEAGASRQRIRPYVEWEYDLSRGEAQGDLPRPTLRARPGRSARPEPMWYSTAFEAVDLLAGPPPASADAEADLVNDLIERLDASRSVEELFDGLRDAEQALLRQVAPADQHVSPPVAAVA